MPQHIQIQNSNFPSQFIDNLNQQQIRNLGNQPKKAKIIKRTKTAVTTQNTGNTQVRVDSFLFFYLLFLLLLIYCNNR